jgi:hypothetical protein
MAVFYRRTSDTPAIPDEVSDFRKRIGPSCGLGCRCRNWLEKLNLKDDKKANTRAGNGIPPAGEAVGQVVVGKREKDIENGILRPNIENKRNEEKMQTQRGCCVVAASAKGVHVTATASGTK